MGKADRDTECKTTDTAQVWSDRGGTSESGVASFVEKVGFELSFK